MISFILARPRTSVFLAILAISVSVLVSRAGMMSSCGRLVAEWPSPDRSWIAELYTDYCDPYDERVVLALRRVGETPRRKQNVVLSSHGNTDTVVFDWLDNSTVALASFDGRFDHSEWPREFRGIKLSYFSYPDQPEASRDPQRRTVSSRQIDFAYRFDPNDKPVPYPGVGCSIQISGEDHPEFAHINIRLYGFKSKPGWGGPLAYVRVVLESSTARPNITAIGVDRFNLPDDLYRDASRTQAMWQVSSEDLMQDISSLRKGSLQLKLGYFLDNTEIVYSNRNDIDITALNEFERCVADNAVFSSNPQ